MSFYEIKITSKSFAQKFELKWSSGGPLSKLCETPPFSINFRCQIENQVSDYRLLGASSIHWIPLVMVLVGFIKSRMLVEHEKVYEAREVISMYQNHEFRYLWTSYFLIIHENWYQWKDESTVNQEIYSIYRSMDPRTERNCHKWWDWANVMLTLLGCLVHCGMKTYRWDIWFPDVNLIVSWKKIELL